MMSYDVRMKDKTVKELFSAPQVATILGVSRKTVWEWTSDGVMTPSAIAGGDSPYYLFDMGEVTRMAETRRLADETKALEVARRLESAHMQGEK